MTRGTAAERTAIVTGAGSGIGRAIALGWAAPGTALWLVGRNAETLESAAAEARRAEATVHVVSLDLSKPGDVERFGERMRKEVDGLDLLVHSAGSHALGKVADAPVAQLDEQYQVNLRGPYALTQALLPLLRSRRGQIVFLNSSAGIASRAGIAAYAASKHGLRAFADALRQEVNPDGIRVVSVFPGRTATPLQAHLHSQEGLPYRPERLIQPDDVAQAVLHAVGLPRTAEITDLHVRPMQPPDS